jgi:hypothetical protein
MHSRIRTSSTLQPSNTTPRNLPPSALAALATMYRQQTKSYGSILRRCTRIPTKASTVVADTAEYPPCLQPPLITRHMRACPMSLCIEATPNPTKRTTAAAHRRIRTTVSCDPSPPITSVLPSRPATTTWSFPNAICTECQDYTHVY